MRVKFEALLGAYVYCIGDVSLNAWQFQLKKRGETERRESFRRFKAVDT